MRGQADRNGDGYVVLDEVWDYVKDKVTDTALRFGLVQTPILDGKYSSGILLSRNPEVANNKGK